ncbi:uncharacterized protein LOC134674163 [Cydia fagiglandana]|uniref:uncharacterized protein LOC134674163 n=1 Tax=Cydia fagiglandana TaxID=1458189 RepID=UPI002FEDFB4B
MVNCAAACGKPMTTSGVAKCTQCPSVYHKACVNMQRVPVGWACPSCKAKTPRRDNTDTPIKNDDLGEEDLSSPASMQDVAEQLRLLRAEFGAVRDEVAGLRREMAELRDMVEGYSSRIGAVEERVRCLEERMEERPAATTDSELAATVAALKIELCDRDQDLLLNDVEITGIPEVQSENSTHLVCLVARKLGVDLEERDIVFAERVGAARAARVRPRPLVVRLARRGPRAELLRAARVRRGADTADFGLPGSPCRFYVNERLTRTNRTLFYLARQECKRLDWRYQWTKDGRVYVRRNKDSAARRLRSESDIPEVFASASVC